MGKISFSALLFLAPCVLCANQWYGDADMFVFTGDSIKLSAPRQSASVYISRESSAAVDAVFSCSVEMDYAPSSVNYVKFYLLSDSEDLSGPLDGYFLRLGYSDKTLSLYRQDGEVIKKLASAVEGLLDSGTPKFTFRVERRGESLWTLYYRDENARNADFVNLSSVEDGTFTHASFMGFAVKFTSTRNEAFRFFNLHVSGENGEERVSLPPPAAGDVFLNEILFNPLPGGADYVEVVNMSGRGLSFAGCSIANGKDTFALPARDIAAGSYMVFTTDSAATVSGYDAEDSFVVETRLPSMPDDAGCVYLHDPDGVVIDSLCYSEDMHSPLVSDAEGVALERCNPLSDVWVSASSFYGYGTPGRQNSQYMQEPENPAGSQVLVSPASFTPDGDGNDDFVRICHSMDGGASGSLYIYHANGYMVKTIYSGVLLSAEDCAVWDGTDDDGRLCPVGIYVALFEAVDENGYATRAKIPFVLSARR